METSISPEQKIETLKNDFNSTLADLEKLDLSLKLADMLSDTDAEQSLEYANKALELAISLEKKKEKGIAQRLMAMAYTGLHKYDQALVYANASLKLFNKEFIDDDEKLATLLAFGRIYFFIGDLNTARKYYVQTLDLGEKLDNIGFILRSCASLALTAYRQGNFSDAKLYTIKGLARDDEAGNNDNAIMYNAVGVVYASQGIYDKSLSYYHKALEIWQKLNMHSFSGYALNNIAIVYQKQDNFKKANAYFQQALKWFELINDQRNQALVYGNIGETYIKMGFPQKSLSYLAKTVEMCEQTQDKFQLASSYYNLAYAHFEINKSPQTVKEYLDKALVLSNEVNNKEVSKDSFELYSKLHLMEDDLPQAIQYQSKSLEVKEELHQNAIKDLQETQDALIKQMEDLYKENKFFKKRMMKMEKTIEKLVNDNKAK